MAYRSAHQIMRDLMDMYTYEFPFQIVFSQLPYYLCANYIHTRVHAGGSMPDCRQYYRANKKYGALPRTLECNRDRRIYSSSPFFYLRDLQLFTDFNII